MKVQIVANYAEMSRIAADIFAEIMASKKDCVLGLATGDTPIGMYECLVEDYKAGKGVILASGEGKAEAVKRMLCGKITTNCPASLLRLHPDVTLICDNDAGKLI